MYGDPVFVKTEGSLADLVIKLVDLVVDLALQESELLLLRIQDFPHAVLHKVIHVFQISKLCHGLCLLRRGSRCIRKKLWIDEVRDTDPCRGAGVIVLIFELHMLLPVAALHQDEVLLEILVPLVRWEVLDALLDKASNYEIFVIELVKTGLLLEELFDLKVSISEILLEMLNGGLDLLNDVDREVSGEQALHTLVHEFKDHLHRVIDFLCHLEQALVVLGALDHLMQGLLLGDILNGVCALVLLFLCL
jgi:hypothetical protein